MDMACAEGLKNLGWSIMIMFLVSQANGDFAGVIAARKKAEDVEDYVAEHISASRDPGTGWHHQRR